MISYNYSLFLIYATSLSLHYNIFLVDSLNPLIPKPNNDPQAELKHPPFLVPIAVGEMYIPPGQVAKEKY